MRTTTLVVFFLLLIFIVGCDGISFDNFSLPTSECPQINVSMKAVPMSLNNVDKVLLIDKTNDFNGWIVKTLKTRYFHGIATEFGSWLGMDYQMRADTLKVQSMSKGKIIIPCWDNTDAPGKICGVLTRRFSGGVRDCTLMPYVEKTETGVRKQIVNYYDDKGNFVKTECLGDPVAKEQKAQQKDEEAFMKYFS